MHWWALLPNVVVVRTGANTLPWLESTLAFITDEAQSSRAGSQTLVGRLSDLLVLHVLRTHLMTLDGTLGSGANWLAALAEPQVGGALALIHAHPAQAWTVCSLARKVGMSRSAFAARFTRLVGEPPLHYLTRLRMQAAAELLRDTGASTAEIAERVGYLSDTAFCKAFKRAFAQSPGSYRRMVKRPKRAEPSANKPDVWRCQQASGGLLGDVVEQGASVLFEAASNDTLEHTYEPACFGHC